MGKMSEVGDRRPEVGGRREREREACAVAAAVCAAVLAVLLAGWLVYLACLRWPALGDWAPPLGWAAMFYGAGVAVSAGFLTGRGA
jgi:hypothetical protein